MKYEPAEDTEPEAKPTEVEQAEQAEAVAEAEAKQGKRTSRRSLKLNA